VSDISHDVHHEKKPGAGSDPIVSKLPAHIKKFRNIIVRFIKRLDQQLDALEHAESSGDLKTVAEIAHWLKGAGGTVGFDVFTEPATQLEMFAKKGRTSQIKNAVANLRQLAKRLVVPDGDIAAASSSSPKLSEEVLLPTPALSDAGSPKPVVSRLANIKRLQPTIISFVEKLDKKVARMQAALENKNMTELAALAHWLKGAGGTVGYDDLTEPAAALESCAKGDHWEAASQTLKEVKLLVTAIVPPATATEGRPRKKPADTHSQSADLV
jgi:HPt (histidine-containing phosphotransfer) domain-containing protein